MSKMKKISIITIILYMLLITSSFAATAIIDVDSARLREESNVNSKVLTNIYKGETVEILEKSGEWCKVKYGNNTGYLKETLIKENFTSSQEKQNNQEDDVVGENKNYSKVVIQQKTNIRYQPSVISNTIIQIESGKELTKELELGNWIKVSDGTIEGWILKAKLSIQNNVSNQKENLTNTEAKKGTTNTVNNTVVNKIENTIVENTTNTTQDNQVTEINKKGIVNVETAKIRKTASTTAKIIGFLDYNDEITIITEEGEFYKFTEKDATGYVHKSLITLVENSVSSRGLKDDRIQEETEEKHKENNNEQLNQNANSKGIEVVEFALKYLGYKYVVGGKNPETGFDCSGFTRFVFLQFGYGLGNTAAEQNNIGTEISRNDLKPGDLILFYDEAKTKIGHTGIYISDGEFIHSANPERGVVKDNINTNSYYNERYIVARRIVE